MLHRYSAIRSYLPIAVAGTELKERAICSGFPNKRHPN